MVGSRSFQPCIPHGQEHQEALDPATGLFGYHVYGALTSKPKPRTLRFAYRHASTNRLRQSSITPVGRDVADYTPAHFPTILSAVGIKVIENRNALLPFETIPEPEEEYTILVRLLRIYLTKTFLPESVIRMKFGRAASYVIDELVPLLVRHRVLATDTYRGKGSQQIFKLTKSMDLVQKALEKADGKLSQFLSAVGNGH